jgi:hypothetical protein
MSNSYLKRKARYEAGLIDAQPTLNHHPQQQALKGIPYRLLSVGKTLYRVYPAEEITKRFNQPG